MSLASSAVAKVPHVTEALCQSLTQRSQQLLDELASTQAAFTSGPCTRTHGAFAFAISQSQLLLRLLEGVRVRVQQERHDSSHAGGGRSAEDRCTQSISPATLSQMEKKRRMLRKVLPHAVSLLEEANRGSGGAAAADAAASLRSLMHTRRMLSLELEKVQTAAQQLSGSAESLGVVRQSLDDVHGAMESAQLAVRRLLTVQNKEDVVLRVSVVGFALVVCYILLQRVFGFFPTTVYVRVDT